MIDKQKIGILSLIALILAIAVYYFANKPVEKLSTYSYSKQIKHDVLTPKKTTVYFTGDVMLDRSVDIAYQTQAGDKMFVLLRDLSKDADLIVVNFEGTFPDIDILQHIHSLFFSFRRELVEKLKESGVNVANLANNHSYNFGGKIYEQTQKNLLNLEFDIFGRPIEGSSDYDILKKNINGIEVNFYGFNALAQTKDEIVNLIINNAGDDTLDIISAHWGNEYEQFANSFQKSTAKAFFEAGADLVVGHHPHVVQPYEIIDGKAVFYSLGNFIFDQYFSQPTQYGLVLKLEIQGDKIIKINALPISNHQSIPKLENPEILNDSSLFPGFKNINIVELSY